MKCDRCHQEKETVCPCYCTMVGSITVMQMVDAPRSIVGPAGKAMQKAQAPLPFTTTLYLCQECNLARVAVEVLEGAFSCEKMAKWLAHGGEDKGVDGPRLTPLKGGQAS